MAVPAANYTIALPIILFPIIQPINILNFVLDIAKITCKNSYKFLKEKVEPAARLANCLNISNGLLYQNHLAQPL